MGGNIPLEVGRILRAKPKARLLLSGNCAAWSACKNPKDASPEPHKSASIWTSAPKRSLMANQY